MLEYNADTPTSIIETSLAQWFWKEDKFPSNPNYDQFNSLYEAITERFKLFKDDGVMHFCVNTDSHEDCAQLEHLASCAVTAGLETKIFDTRDLAFDDDEKFFVDDENIRIGNLFKLYPWEWLSDELITANRLDFLEANKTKFIEPIWKMLLSNKALLALLWEKFPNHPNLLPAYFSPEKFQGKSSYIRKPFLSREGKNIAEFNSSGQMVSTTDVGEYKTDDYVYQEKCRFNSFSGLISENCLIYPENNYYTTVMGVWIVGDEPCGLAIREDCSAFTKDSAYFVPHFFEKGTK